MTIHRSVGNYFYWLILVYWKKSYFIIKPKTLGIQRLFNPIINGRNCNAQYGGINVPSKIVFLLSKTFLYWGTFQSPEQKHSLYQTCTVHTQKTMLLVHPVGCISVYCKWQNILLFVYWHTLSSHVYLSFLLLAATNGHSECLRLLIGNADLQSAVDIQDGIGQ